MKSKVAFLGKVNQIIASNLNNPELKGALIAKSLGISRMQLHRLLKRTIQENANSLITKKRMQYAKKELQTTTKYIYQIAEEVGYAAPNYFAKVFKKKVGQTPSQFRQNESALF